MALVRPNISKVRLSEAKASRAMDSEAYVHVVARPRIPIKRSIIKRYWKECCAVSLSVCACFALVSHPSLDRANTDTGTAVSLAALADLNNELLLAAQSERDSVAGEEALTPVVYTGSEYQARLEFEKTQIPVVDVNASSQLITESKLIRRSTRIVGARPEHREDLRSMVKFISGLIAVHRPNIQDCGAVAAEIVKIAARENVDPFLVAAIISVESRFANTAKSSVGAVGLMQLMPATAKEVASASKKGKPTLTDIATNIQLGIDYWKQLSKRYRGNTFLALSAYNWGPGNVDKVGRNPTKVPGSVSKYARTIIDRHKNWVNHFENAKAGASKLG